MALQINIYPKGPLDENTYLITDENTNKVLIDPGYIGDDILETIGEKSSLKYIILTHAHFDHFNSLKEYLLKFPEAKFLASKNEKNLIAKYNCDIPNLFVDESSIIDFENRKLQFIETPGHTEGGICVLLDEFLFSGDTLFKHSIGNTSFETGDFNQLIDSISNKLFLLPEETVVFPGHGEKTSIGEEKRMNPFV